jgi:YVTN family beta-propeller protein
MSRSRLLPVFLVLGILLAPPQLTLAAGGHSPPPIPRASPLSSTRTPDDPSGLRAGAPASPRSTPLAAAGLETAWTLSLATNRLFPGYVLPSNAFAPAGIAVDPNNGQLYVTVDGDLDILNATNDSLTTSSGLTNFNGGVTDETPVFDPANQAVYYPSGNDIDEMATATGQLVGTVAVGSGPAGLALDPTTGMLYTANEYNDSVSVVSVALVLQKLNISVAAHPEGVAYDPANGDVYVANSGVANVSIISTATNSVVGAIPVGNAPFDVVYDGINQLLYVSNSGSNNVSVINGTTNKVVATIPTGMFTTPHGLAYDNQTRQLLVADYGTGFASIFSTATNKLVGSVAVGENPQGITVDPALGEFFVANAYGNTVAAVNDTSDLVVHSTLLGSTPEALTVDPSTGMVYVGAFSSNISLVPTANLSTSRWVSAGYGIGPELYDAVDNDVYISDEQNGTLELLSPSTNRFVKFISLPGSFGNGPQAGALSVDPTSGDVFATQLANGALDIVTPTGAITVVDPRISSGYSFGNAYSPATGDVYTSNSYFANVTVTSTATDTVVGSVPVGSGPYGLTYDSQSSSIAVGSGSSDNISLISSSGVTSSLGGIYDPTSIVYDAALNAFVTGGVYNANTFAVRLTNATTGASLGTVNTGYAQNSIAYDPANQYVYVANYFSGTLSVLVPTDLPTPRPTVTFYESPSTCPSLTFNGTPESNGATSSFVWGSYPALAASCPGYTFAGWSLTGGVKLGASQGLSADVNVVSNGTVTADYTPVAPGRAIVNFFVSPTGCGPIAFNGSAQASGSSAPFPLGNNYTAVANPCVHFGFLQWNTSGGVSVSRASSSSVVVTISGAGSLTAYYTWSGSGGTTGVVTFSIYPAACGPLDFGGLSENNGATGSFATGNYSAAGSACTGYGSLPTWAVSGALQLPPLKGNPTNVWVKGSGMLYLNYTAVPPPPVLYTVQFVVSPASCGPVLFNGSSVASGGSNSFQAGTYEGFAPACSGYAFSSWTYQPTSGPNHLYGTAWVNITVGANATVTATYTALPPSLGVTLSPNATTAYPGSPIVLTTAVTGGLAPYSCELALNGTNMTAFTCSQTVTVTFAHPGDDTYRVWATDSQPVVAGSLSVTLDIIPRPGVRSPPLVDWGNASATTVDLEGCSGTPQQGWDNFTGAARGGSPPYAFLWSFGDGSGSASTQNATHIYVSGGRFTASLQVTDEHGSRAWSNQSITTLPTTCTGKTMRGTVPSNGSGGFSLLGLGTLPSILLLVLPVIVVLAALVLVLRRRKRGNGLASAAPPAPTPPGAWPGSPGEVQPGPPSGPIYPGPPPR